jgi:hypothetical protein
MMEIINVALTPLQRRNRAVFLDQADFDAQVALEGRDLRVLEPGEKVVLHADGDYFAGTVIDQVSTDKYLISMGVRMPAEWAYRRAGRPVPAGLEATETATGETNVRTQELLDLLGELRKAGGVPASATSTTAAPRRRAR